MSAPRWDAIIIGSGIGGLACAAALAKCGRKALVLEQHFAAGGLTQTFSREGYTWDVGLHYLGDMGPQGVQLLDWISEGGIEVAPTGATFDTVHFPGGFEFSFASPEEATRRSLQQQFPEAGREIDDFFEALDGAQRAAMAVFRMRALPGPLAAAYRWWTRRLVERWVARSIDEVLRETISDPKLRAVLSSQWPDHGGSPRTGSFAMHAQVMRHFLGGSRYPVGGAGVFAKALVPVIERAGGAVALNARVERLLVEGGRVAGARLADGSEHRAAAVISACGARNTVESLLPAELRDAQWVRDILSLELSPCHAGLYLGLAGDIRTAGATTANHWIYGTWDTGAATWRDPERTEPPLMFISFPSLKDADHDPGPQQRNTAEPWCGWTGKPAPWQDSSGQPSRRVRALQGDARRTPVGPLQALFSAHRAADPLQRGVHAAHHGALHPLAARRGLRSRADTRALPVAQPRHPHPAERAVSRRAGCREPRHHGRDDGWHHGGRRDCAGNSPQADLMIEFKLPSLGADMDEGKLLEWKVRPGDKVKRGDLVAVVETPKAAVDVEIWQDGVVRSSTGHTIHWVRSWRA
jgi:all-trans-retinol 13,14-reductase